MRTCRLSFVSTFEWLLLRGEGIGRQFLDRTSMNGCFIQVPGLFMREVPRSEREEMVVLLRKQL